jgi:hypothetical protein
MSLGLFNCRLIQPAGDQLFFFAGCLAAPAPVRASSVQSPCDASCPAPTSGRAQNASCFSFSERFCLGFQRARSPRRVQEGSTPTDSATNSPEDPPILPIDSAIEPCGPAKRSQLGFRGTNFTLCGRSSVVVGILDTVRLRGWSRGEDFVAAAGAVGLIAARIPAANGLDRISGERCLALWRIHLR